MCTCGGGDRVGGGGLEGTFVAEFSELNTGNLEEANRV